MVLLMVSNRTVKQCGIEISHCHVRFPRMHPNWRSSLACQDQFVSVYLDVLSSKMEHVLEDLASFGRL